ncbi:MAG: response regulator [Magnetococcales bacterium]|nr:response regulator [Magnetococcales bacterium]
MKSYVLRQGSTWRKKTWPIIEDEVFTQQILPHGKSQVCEKEWIRKDGTRIPVEIRTFLLRDNNDQPEAMWSIVRNITERKRIEANLKLAKEQAEHANRAKTAFLTTMSHEIRTPMNGVLGMADLLLHTALSNQQRHYAEAIQRSGRILLRIINDILDFSKMQAGRLSLELLRFDLDEVIVDLNDMFMAQARRKKVDFHCALTDSVPIHLLGDFHRLKQILFNLIGNAIKFTENGSVDVVVEVMEEREIDTLLRFRVTDTGMGISPEFQQQLFQDYSQEDTSISRRFGGTGLGLAISRRLATMMDGELQVESTPGQGSSFWFTARFGKQRAGDRKAISMQPTRRKSISNSDFRGRRILLVEDNHLNQEVAAAMFEMFGFQVTVANNGQDAISIYRATPTPFDAIFLDCEMPVLNGFETTKQLRQWELEHTNRHTPIIALTAHVLQECRKECLEAGMDDFLQKPLNLTDLEPVLRCWIDPNDQSDQIAKTTASDALATHESQDRSPLPTPDRDHPRKDVNTDAAHSSPILDLSTLSCIQNLAQKGNPMLPHRMMDHFMTQTQKLLSDLELAIERQDSQGVSFAAHSLKSSSLSMGAVSLARLGHAMEENHSRFDIVANHFSQCHTTFAEASEALNRFLILPQESEYREGSG